LSVVEPRAGLGIGDSHRQGGKGFDAPARQRALEHDPVPAALAGGVEDEVAEAVRDQAAPIPLDGLRGMGVVADHEVRPRVDQAARDAALGFLRLARVLDSPV